jgi:hypothetical protein
MRNVGGSVGTSMVSTMLARRSQFRQSVLAEHTRSMQFSDATDALVRHLNYGGMGQIDSHANAIGRLAHMVQAQAAVLSYIYIYWVIAVWHGADVPLVIFPQAQYARCWRRHCYPLSSTVGLCANSQAHSGENANKSRRLVAG